MSNMRASIGVGLLLALTLSLLNHAGPARPPVRAPASDRTIGTHAGIHRYTIGQRRGIGIADERPLYVISVDAPTNRVTVGSQEELLSSEFTAAGVNWIAIAEPDEQVRAGVRVRYRHSPAPATITTMPNQRARIVFDEPQRAITPGQATVFYRGDEVVGGGWIVRGS